ncbi:hypothetical protein BSKO_03215 [Bryopsis sp. KO-2023]|nr:hypothetical protein BSKO_03215 [Bryopsis sp. KO-2023]
MLQVDDGDTGSVCAASDLTFHTDVAFMGVRPKPKAFSTCQKGTGGRHRQKLNTMSTVGCGSKLNPFGTTVGTSPAHRHMSIEEEWKVLEVRLPARVLGKRSADASERIRHFLKEKALGTEESQITLSLMFQDTPSERRSAQLLGYWLDDQLTSLFCKLPRDMANGESCASINGSGRFAKVLDWEGAARAEIEGLTEYVKDLQRMLLLAEGERDNLLCMNEELASSHSKSMNEIQKSRAKKGWDNARRRTQSDEKLKKMKTDIRQLLRAVKISRELCGVLQQRLKNAEKIMRLLFRALRASDQQGIRDELEEDTSTIQRGLKYIEKAEGYVESFLAKDREDEGKFSKVVAGLDRSDRTISVQLEKTVSTDVVQTDLGRDMEQNSEGGLLKNASLSLSVESFFAAFHEELLRKEISMEEKELTTPALDHDPEKRSSPENLSICGKEEKGTQCDLSRSDSSLESKEKHSAQGSSIGSRTSSITSQPERAPKRVDSHRVPFEAPPWEERVLTGTLTSEEEEALRDRIAELETQVEDLQEECDGLRENVEEERSARLEIMSSRDQLAEKLRRAALPSTASPSAAEVTIDKTCDSPQIQETEESSYDVRFSGVPPSPRSPSSGSKSSRPQTRPKNKTNLAAEKIQEAFRRHSAKRKNEGEEASQEKEVPTSVDETVRNATEMLTNFTPANSRLLDALKKHSGIKPRSPEWLLKFIDGLYRAKMQNDEQRALAGSRKQSLADFMFKHLAGLYGTKTLVTEYSAAIVATVNKHHRSDLRIEIFGHFLSEFWDANTLDAFLESYKKLSEPSKIPGLEYPPDYGKRLEPAFVDLRKCLYIADAILGARKKEVALRLAALLSEKETDVNRDGVLSKDEITGMLMGFGGKDMPSDAFERVVDEFWVSCIVAHLMAKGSGWKKKEQIPDLEMEKVESVGLQAFMEAGMKSDIMRSYIRLYRTPVAPKATSQDEEQSLGMCLLMLVNRHWEISKKALVGFISKTGNQEPILLEKVSRIQHEINGLRKAQIYHNVLNLLCEHFLTDVKTKLSPNGMKQDPDSVEPTLMRLLGAVKVMYGYNFILEEDLLDDEVWTGSSTAQKSLQARMVGDAAKVFNRMKGKMENYAMMMLRHNGRFWVQRWRSRVRTG